MDLSDKSTIHAPDSVIDNTINHFPSSSERASGTKRKSAEDAEVRKILASRAVKSASFDAAERGDPPTCHPDTRIAAQDSLIAWRSNRTAGPVRLISGWVGTGKTTIAQTMAEYWAKHGQLAGSFFFSRSSKERSQTNWVLETILHQFLQVFGADVDIGHLSKLEIRDKLVKVLESVSPSLREPVVIVIDGLDEISITDDRVSLLGYILSSLDRLGSSIKFLISCRPERPLDDLFHEFAPKLGSSYRIHLGQSAGDNDDIRTFFLVSFNQICQHRRLAGAISIKAGPWPSQKEVEWLVDRASGQFVFAATGVRFVDDENEDPVEMLNLIMEQRTSSFEAIDQLYIVILNRVGMRLGESSKSLEFRQLMQNLILHVNHQPSSSLAIADFWFEKEVMVKILVSHLQPVLARNPNSHGQNSENVIQFRHKSFHDFFARPFAPHPFSLASMNPVSKFFFSLRTHPTASRPGHDDRPPTISPYGEEARRMHQAYIRDRPTFRGCKCLPQLESAISDISALRAFKPCRQSDCVANSDLLKLCRMMVMRIDNFTREQKEQEHSRTSSFPILKFLIWFRVMVYDLLSDPSTAAYETIRPLISRPSSLNWKARCLAVVNGHLCVAILLNTRWDVVLVLYFSHAVAIFLLRRFLHFDTLQMWPWDTGSKSIHLGSHYIQHIIKNGQA
ncbi:hypothetical protein BDN72DRAFT_904028 [Pluteus cervinus]|uniref:Uncharacterized protein n=1 Tax=Pluteus cervinus TaxID=181527 RepID=A0ACD3A726_9AGAR|nr:hypothetical protein BDN72DRAFT_904028 [Pluteus cervinus]